MNPHAKKERPVAARPADVMDAPSAAELTKLVAEYHEAVQADIHKDPDCHWQISERWSCGEHAGWFVEHHGYLYELADGEFGEAGPYPSREEALRRLAEQLRVAIADTRNGHGG